MHPITVSTEEFLICPDDPLKCDFECPDSSSLIRHRKRIHGYVPRRRRKSRKSKPSDPASLPPVVPEPSSSLLSPSPDFHPIRVGETSSSFPPMPPSLHYQENLFPGSPPPRDGYGRGFGAAEPQMNGSHGLFGPADPTPSPGQPFYQAHNNYTAEFQDSQYSQLSQAPTSYTNGSMPVPILPTYYSPLDQGHQAFPSPFIDYSADQSNQDFQVIKMIASADYFDQCRWDFVSGTVLSVLL